jgi:hypothetical protein
VSPRLPNRLTLAAGVPRFPLEGETAREDLCRAGVPERSPFPNVRVALGRKRMPKNSAAKAAEAAARLAVFSIWPAWESLGSGLRANKGRNTPLPPRSIFGKTKLGCPLESTKVAEKRVKTKLNEAKSATRKSFGSTMSGKTNLVSRRFLKKARLANHIRGWRRHRLSCRRTRAVESAVELVVARSPNRATGPTEDLSTLPLIVRVWRGQETTPQRVFQKGITG